MKKIIVCMICICIALAGCGKEKSVVKEKKQKEVLRLTTKGKELLLKNLMNYKVVNKYKLGKKQCTGSIIDLIKDIAYKFMKQTGIEKSSNSGCCGRRYTR